MNNKILDLKEKKELVLEKIEENNIEIKEVTTTKEDIALRIERELSKIATVEYIDKTNFTDENGLKTSTAQVKLIGDVYNILRFEEYLKNIKISTEINSMEINNITNSVSEEGEPMLNVVECVMTITLKDA